MSWLDNLAAKVAKMTEAPWFTLNRSHGGCGVNRDQERIYAVEICGNPRCRDGSLWSEGKKRWYSHIVAVIQDWNEGHAGDRDGIVALRNHADRLIAIARAAEAAVVMAEGYEERMECNYCQSWKGTEENAVPDGNEEDPGFTCPQCGEAVAHLPLDEQPDPVALITALRAALEAPDGL